MKKLLLIICLLSVFYGAFAQQIEFRRILFPEGLSVMTSEKSVIAMGKPVVWYALQYIKSPDGSQEQYYLHVFYLSESSRYVVPDGGKLLIRTTAGKVLSFNDIGIRNLRAYDPESDINTDMRRERLYEGNVNLILKVKGNRIHSAFAISKEDLQTLTKEGIMKLRLETDVEPLEFTLENKKAKETANVLEKQYQSLQNQIDPYNNL